MPSVADVRSESTVPPPAFRTSVHIVLPEQITGHEADRLSAIACPKFSPRVGKANASYWANVDRTIECSSSPQCLTCTFAGTAAASCSQCWRYDLLSHGP